MFLIFDPQGFSATRERDLIVTAVAVMLVIVVPVLAAFFTFARRYRARPGADAAPEAPEDGKRLPEFFWWLLPCAVVAVLGVITWRTAHALDPQQPIPAGDPAAQPLTIDVVALDWKWLFIYPQQGIATVNFVEFPVNAPLDFELTAGDAPMNSFWIPQIGGQMYAMPGMVNHLHLMATAPGDFAGSAAEINGPGFAGMKFVAKSVSEPDFQAWAASVRNGTSSPLTKEAYNALAAPSAYNPQAFYSSVGPNLYNSIVGKYLAPRAASSTGSAAQMSGMNMNQ